MKIVFTVIGVLGASFILWFIVSICRAICCKYHLFETVKGRITHDGDPVQGAIVKRLYRSDWFDKTSNVDSVVTNENGKYIFLSVSKCSMSAILPHEPVIRQKIWLETRQGDIVLHEAVKRTYREGIMTIDYSME